eukprot:CAMPEP_0113880268 /NCGR_PEP_ID=MMETSP0780_2-20120614/7690_1 /TAXON_ID=652834 /ORGANISM="Palpitomonas bilix" /LENGTH=386 /DNA_ID=CAMNT_0000866923 /DNA_START=236 /DNA_END=1396 /DNA_ORIENTATION=+ /assembly_acc=CAM_ASM_000599
MAVSLMKDSLIARSHRARAFVVIMSIECVLLSGFSLAKIALDIENHDDIAFTLSVLTTVLFFAFLLFDAVINENQYELIAFFTLSVVLIIRVIYEFFSDAEKSCEILAVNFFAALTSIIFQMALFPLGALVYKELGWKAFLYFERDKRKIKMYSVYQVFVAFLKFDFQFGILFTIFSYYFAPKGFGVPLAVFCFATTIAQPLLGYFGARKERRDLMALHMILVFALPILSTFLSINAMECGNGNGVEHERNESLTHCPFKFLSTFENSGSGSGSFGGGGSGEGTVIITPNGTKYGMFGLPCRPYNSSVGSGGVEITVVGASALSLVCRLFVIIYAIRVSFNFGKGLKDTFKKEPRRKRTLTINSIDEESKDSPLLATLGGRNGGVL